MEGKKPVIVTTSWDDGHKLDMKLFKLLNKYGIKGTFYICIDRPNFKRISDEEIKKIGRKHEIGAHTVTHPHLNQISLEEAKKEILDSKLYLENLLKKKIYSFAYPYGHFTSDVKEFVSQHFKLARGVKRFEFEIKDRYNIGITIDPCRSVKGNIYHLLTSGILGIKFFFSQGFSRNWELLAKKTFDFVLKHGGIWHLMGHSQEIEEKNLWDSLERILEYVSGRKNVIYCYNRDLLFYK